MNPSAPFQTAVDVAYDTIKANILNGSLAPGMKLSRRKMAALTGVSVIPVIEACHRLERDGIVESMPHWGTRVTLLTDERIHDHFVLREAIECQVARELTGKLTPAQSQHLKGLAHEVDTSRSDEEGHWEKHYHFHLQMAEYTACVSLVDALNRSNLFALLRNAVSRRRQQQRALPEDWHSRLIVAIESGDADHAAQVMRVHVHDSLTDPEAER